VHLASRSRIAWLLALTLLVGLALVVRPAEAASGEFYAWAKWRLGHAPYTCQAGAPWVRPNVRRRVPESWWRRLERYRPAPCHETADPPVEPTDVPIAQIGVDPREAALRDAVNAERSRHGLAPLALHPSLQRAARAHAKDMIRFGYFGHDWHDGTPFGTWMGRHTACVTSGEILAWRSPQQSPGGAVRQWLESPGHRAALLSNTWTAMGVELTRRHAAVEFGRRC
jgi:Cysteine-rich secretory protein family